MTEYLSLMPLLRPRSVGIVGASATPGSFGHRTLDNLRASGFGGRIVCVNPRYADIDGVPCVPSIDQVGEPLDTVVVVVPAQRVPGVLADVAATGSRSAVVMSSGFAESGSEGSEWEATLRTLSSEQAMPIVGPNSLGLLNFVHPCALTFGPGFGSLVSTHAAGADEHHRQGLAVVSQSGALGSFLLHATNRGVRIAHSVATGNSAAIDVGDAIAGLCREARDEITAICLAYEGLRPGTELLGALDLAAECGVPVVALKSGRSVAGHAAAMSHTGSAVGDSRAWRVALEARGVMCVDSLEQLLEPAEFLAKAATLPNRRAGGVAIATGSGGAGVLTCDLAATHGAPIATFGTDTSERLRGILPSFSAVTNPLDITAAGAEHHDVLIDAVEMVAADPAVGVVVVPLGIAPGSTGPTAGRPAALAEAADRIDIPLAVVWLGQDQTHPAVELLTTAERAGYFSGIDLCMRTVAHLLGRQHPDQAPGNGAADAIDAGPLLGVLGPSAGTPDEAVGYQALESIGIASARHVVARTLADLETAVRSWDHYPAVLKIVSPDIAHKAAVGGVRTHLAGPDDVLAAGAAILRAVADRAPDAEVRGLLLQEMLLHRTEVLVGGVNDQQYGPVVAVGVGGGNAGAGGAVSVAAAPLTRASADELVRSSCYLGHLDDVQASAVADVVVRVGDLLAGCPAVSEIDINPVLVGRDGNAVAADALVVIDEANVPTRAEETV